MGFHEKQHQELQCTEFPIPVDIITKKQKKGGRGEGWVYCCWDGWKNRRSPQKFQRRQQCVCVCDDLDKHKMGRWIVLWILYKYVRVRREEERGEGGPEKYESGKKEKEGIPKKKVTFSAFGRTGIPTMFVDAFDPSSLNSP